MRMKVTRRLIATVLSVLYLAVFTALAAYATYQVNHLSLPIPETLSALALALPPLAGLALETSTALGEQISVSPKYARRHASNIPAVLLPSTLTILGLVVLEAVIASLAGTHIAPIGGLGCALRERWTDLYRSKNANALQTIQDSLQCCGFQSDRDMPFPFPRGDPANGGVTAGACVQLYPARAGRACQALWREREQTAASLMVVVPVAVFLWMVVIIATPAIHPSWARQTLRLAPRAITNGEGDTEQRVVAYEPYSDDPAEEEECRREIEDLNNDSRLALEVERSRDHPSNLVRDHQNEWERD